MKKRYGIGEAEQTESNKIERTKEKKQYSIHTYVWNIFTIQYLLKAIVASNGVITGARYALLSSRAVWGQETFMKTSH